MQPVVVGAIVSRARVSAIPRPDLRIVVAVSHAPIQTLVRSELFWGTPDRWKSSG